VTAYCLTRAGTCWVDFPGVATFAFTADPSAVRAIAHAGASSDEVIDTYRRHLVPVLLQALGREVLHASAVLAPGGVVGFCGVAGTGKSTTAFGLAARGYAAWADDALAVDMSGDGPIGTVPLPFGLRLRPAAASYFGANALARAPEAGHDARDGAEPLSTLFVLMRSRVSPPAVHRLRPSQAFAALLPHAYCFSVDEPQAKQRLVERYAALASRVPVYRLDFEPALERLPDMLDIIEQTIR
jgi:hypothetical protein